MNKPTRNKHPLFKIANDALVDLSTPSTIRGWWNFGSLLGICLVAPIMWWYQRLYNTICPPDDEQMCSKHVEAWNKLIIKFSASSWLILRTKYIEMHGQQNIKKRIFCSLTSPPLPPKIVLFLRQSGKIWYSQTGHRWQYNTSRAFCLLGIWGYKHRHSEYVILTAIPQQEWLRERASVLRYTYVACLVYCVQN